jgi:hypothetical protein
MRSGAYSTVFQDAGCLTLGGSGCAPALAIAHSADIIVTGVHGLGAIDGNELLALLPSVGATGRKKPARGLRGRMQRVPRDAVPPE